MSGGGKTGGGKAGGKGTGSPKTRAAKAGGAGGARVPGKQAPKTVAGGGGARDMRVKVKKARDFLENKDKVLVNVLFRGREMAHIEEGRRVLEEVITALEDVAKIEKPPAMEGRRMTAMVAPR